MPNALDKDKNGSYIGNYKISESGAPEGKYLITYLSKEDAGKDLSKADISLNLYAWNLAQRTGNPVEILCAIGDESVVIQSGSEEFVKPFEEIVHEVKGDIMINHGGFERFAEWGYF